MIAARHMKGLKVAIFGLGRSGLAAALSCRAGGAEVIAWDDNRDAQQQARHHNIALADFKEMDFTTLDRLVLAPGVPLTHPAPHWVVEKAHQAGVKIIGDTEVFVQELSQQTPRPKLVAVTGTNGKSTTTALIGHILSGAMPTQIGGNIGVPVLELEPFSGDGVYVIEFSSYQIDLTPSLKPDIAICLNLSPDHLDRHGDMTHYAAVKEKIFAHQQDGDFAILGDDDAHCTAMAGRIMGPTLIPISGYHKTDGFCVVGGELYKGHSALGSLGVLKNLLGQHNGQNIAASFAASQALGLKDSDIFDSIRTFPGLSHRMEYVGSINGVDVINDSKATNVDAAAMALSSLDHIHWILGGLAKEGGIASLMAFADRISHAYLIGDASEEFGKTLKGNIAFTLCKTMEQAVQTAAKNAVGEGEQAVILLSPAAASFDHYKNFEDRGDDFKKHISRLDGFKRQGGTG